MDQETLRQQCLAVLRTIAQPISIITTLDREHEESLRESSNSDLTSLPFGSDDVLRSKSSTTRPSESWHGATLSSFTSVAMHPYPLVSFALRTPSRMADLLRPLTEKAIPNSESSTSPSPKIHLAINLLASHQSHLAIHFSRPRGSWTLSEPSSVHQSLPADIQYSATPEGIPILHNTLGALCCTVVKSIPLDTIHSESTRVSSPSVHSHTPTKTSELFIAQVMSVLPSPQSKEFLGKELLPLIYHKQKYYTVK